MYSQEGFIIYKEIVQSKEPANANVRNERRGRGVVGSKGEKCSIKCGIVVGEEEIVQNCFNLFMKILTEETVTTGAWRSFQYLTTLTKVSILSSGDGWDTKFAFVYLHREPDEGWLPALQPNFEFAPNG